MLRQRDLRKTQPSPAPSLDSTGAVVPDVTITLTNQATGQVRTEVSNSSGTYVFANVGVGQFTLCASGKAFEKYTRTGIVVNVDQSLKEDVTLTIGSEGRNGHGSGGCPTGAERNQRAQHSDHRRAGQQLATNGRNVTSLAALGMGVSNNLPAFSGVNALTSANGISSMGPG